jgi:hypothetical protein
MRSIVGTFPHIEIGQAASDDATIAGELRVDLDPHAAFSGEGEGHLLPATEDQFDLSLRLAALVAGA